jgi:hypothetical protein|nr:hypothetical protein Q903MT_gene4600 [Picea sitchensis]
MKIHGNTISKHLLPLDFPTLYFFASTLLPGLYTSSIHLFVLLHPSIPSLRPFLVSIPPISLFHFLLPTAPFFVSSLTLVSIPSGLYSLFHSSCLLYLLYLFMALGRSSILLGLLLLLLVSVCLYVCLSVYLTIRLPCFPSDRLRGV